MKYKIIFLLFSVIFLFLSFVSAITIEENTQFQTTGTNTTFIFGNNLTFELVEVHANYFKLDNNTISAAPSVGSVNITILNFTDDYKKWNETPSNTSTTRYIIGGFASNTEVQIRVNNVNWNSYTSNSTGYIDFNYSGYSTMQFEASKIECGNGICEEGETCSSCPSDCGACPSSSSGGGGGGSSTVTKFVNIDIKEEGKEAKVILRAKEKAKFVYSGVYHTITPTQIGKDYITIEVASIVKTATLKINESEEFNLDTDNYYDVYVKLDNIINNKAYLTIKKIREQILPTATLPKVEKGGTVEVPEEILLQIKPEEVTEEIEKLAPPKLLGIIKNKLSLIKNMLRKTPSKVYVFALIIVAISSLMIFSFKAIESRKIPDNITYNSVLYNYMQRAIKKGFDKKIITETAIRGGWKKGTIDRMFKKIKKL